MTYLVDIFAYITEVNVSMQGHNINILKVQGKIESILMKLVLWSELILNENLKGFSYVKE